MFPVYRYMDPYCQTFPQRESNSSACQYYPSWDHAMPHMKADPSKQLSVFMPPHFNYNICHPYPGDHGGGCHHNCPPGYYNFRPQFSPVQPPPQPYFNGLYPPYPGPYPAYFIPPPHYSVDQARYDYDKVRDHCCGCPNHKCHQGGDSLPKIEELKTEKAQDGESSGLIRWPNYSSPVVWVPANSIKDKEGDKSAELKPGYWNGWVPLDINNLKGLSQEEEGEMVQQVDDKSAQARSPFPIIWLPHYNKPEGEVKDLKEITPNSVEDWPSKFKIVPLKFLENENHGERRPRVVQEEPEPENQIEKGAPVEKQTKIKTIPVKQVEETSQKKTSVSEKQEGNVPQNKATVHQKRKDESEVDKASEKKQSSPVRSSKLPPVCLRVDPLPRKTRTTGTSRSPSPPGYKDKRERQNNEEQSLRTERKEEILEKVIPVVNVKDNTLSQVQKEQKFQSNVSVAPTEVFSKESKVQETAKELTEGSRTEEKELEEKKTVEPESEQEIEVHKGSEEPSENKEVKEKKEAKRDLSQTDAAVIIQSAYRGFEVRRWYPLEKLRKIAKIREQVNIVRRQVESIEVSQKELDAKQRMVVGETIMNLLLQLDAMQGLHPSVREERKAVARELTCLQDKLDSLHSHIAVGHGSAKVEDVTKATTDSAVALVSSSADTTEEPLKPDTTEEALKQDSPEDKIDTASIETTEDPAQEETKATIDCAAAFVSSSADIKEESLKQDSLEGKIDNTSVEATEGLAQSDVSLIESSHTGEVISVTSPPLPSESTDEQESMLPTKDGATKDQASFGSNDETAISIAASGSEQGVNQSEPTSVEAVKEISASENLYLQCKETEPKLEGIIVGAQAEIDKSTDLAGNDGIVKNQASFGSDSETVSAASPAIAATGSEQGANQSEPPSEQDIVETVEENSASENLSVQSKESEAKREAIIVGTQANGVDESAGLAYDDGSCKRDESTDALICNGEEEHSKLSSEDAGPGLDDKGLLERSKEVKYHEHEVMPDDRDDHGAEVDANVLVGAEELQQALDVGERVIAKEIESELETEKKEDAHDGRVVILLSPLVDGSDGINISIPVEDVDGTCHKDDSCPNLAIGAPADKKDRIISQDLLKSKVTDDANEENRSKGCGENIEGPITEMHPPVGKDAMNELGDTPVAEQELDVAINNCGSSSSTCPAPDPTGKEVKDANQVKTNENAAMDEAGRKLMEENEMLRKMLHELLEAGKEQLGVITNLNGRVKDLERKLAQKKKAIKVKRSKAVQLHSCEVSS